MGAVAATTGAMPAISQAATINIPGLGSFDLPPELEQPAQQLEKELQAMVAPQGQAAPQLPSVTFDNPFQQQQTAANIALDAARTKVGAQYNWGAAGPSSFDCSGLVQWAYRQAGVELPRTSFEQSHVGAPVSFDNLQAGDIVITNGGGHVGIYAGNGQLLNAVQSGTPVSYTQLSADDVVTARRII
ncbi:C40 family peptidase [Nocardia mangyaensis]|uniref:C40 family peptidase n=1 Tax=Nocardia mangyaensis TaxID=2213200 RepID=UPI00267681F6|nr:C40 family peptidase [Nocardia mangyaensis]MDO3650477.1 C40 family peptidase [Nocardia mangyaensis]